MAKSKHTIETGDQIASFKVNCGILNITVDPRLELLAVIQYLAGSQLVERDRSGYAAAIDEWFAHFKVHPVFEHLRQFESKGFSHDLPVFFFLQHTGIPLVRIDKAPQPYMQAMNKSRLRYVAKKADFKAFIDEVNDFVRISDFALFFLQQETLFQNMLNTAENLLGKAGVVETMIEWYGYHQHSFNLCISPLQGCGGYGLGFISDKEGCDLYCISALQGSNATQENLIGMATMLFHEFSHTYINHLVDENYPLLKKAKHLHKPIAAKLAALAYPSWWVVVVEHYVRAATLRLMAANTQLNTSLLSLRFEESQGFIYLSHFHECLLQYEATRKQTGVTFMDYFPHLVDRLVEYSRLPHPELHELMRFSGPIGGITGFNSIIIIPDPELNPGVDECIMGDVNFMVGRFGMKVYTDTQALDLRFPGMDIYVYGPPACNKWLGRIEDTLPFRILADKILADKAYPGTDLRIISCLPNPDDSSFGMGIYTAQTMEAMKSSNTIFHGPEDFVVSDSELNILGKGNYLKNGAQWSLLP